MKIGVFSTKPYDQRFLERCNQEFGHELDFFEPYLATETAILADGYESVCAFVNDQLDADVLAQLYDQGTRLIALRCAGFNNVDMQKAAELGIRVVRVPAYSPHSVAEHAVGLILALNRKIHRAHNRVQEGNFALDGLLGFDLHGRTVGVIGTGNIGIEFARIMCGFGCRVLGYDPHPHDGLPDLGGQYVQLEELYAQSDILSLHCPLMPATQHMIDADSIAQMKQGVMIINTSRGALVDTPAAVAALKSGKIGYLGLDVYEEEGDLFFKDMSDFVIQDDVFARLLTFPNVLITGHQAFFTEEALTSIAQVTLGNVTAFEKGEPLENEIEVD